MSRDFFPKSSATFDDSLTSNRQSDRWPGGAAVESCVFRVSVACLLCLLVFDSSKTIANEHRRQPNVILVMTDDQGYGDLGCHGNSVIQTPAMDALHADSLRLTNYHVDPTCSPTRSALMTGRYSSRTGVWHTVMGRSILRSDETTLADLFAAAGYRTGVFGKWHLGDNAPSRPQDVGFHEVLIHGGGGVGQTPDFWGNDYFDDTYRHNGKLKKFSGYCTDVWFDAALKFVEENRDRPFFAYIPTNAAHGPFNVAKKYSEPYRKKGVPSPRAEFYGMITNIDENLARLVQKLDQLSHTENTLLIFTTDNGTAAGMRDPGGYNSGMRGTKGSEYEGGHRVPCFLRWPAKNYVGGRDIDALCAHIDILPTLVEVCGLALPKDKHIDGKSLVPLLNGSAPWKPRTLFVHSQRIEHPKKWRKSAVMTDRWRLINGRELYDLKADSGQKQDVASQHAQVVSSLRQAYETWYAHISKRFDEYVRIDLGSRKENPSHLTAHDWHTPIRDLPWNQSHIKRSLRGNGFWTVNIVREGNYRFTLRNRPTPIEQTLSAKQARLQVGHVKRSLPVKTGATAVTFTVPLKAGPVRLQTWLDGKPNDSRGAYFVDVERLD